MKKLTSIFLLLSVVLTIGICRAYAVVSDPIEILPKESLNCWVWDKSNQDKPAYFPITYDLANHNIPTDAELKSASLYLTHHGDGSNDPNQQNELWLVSGQGDPLHPSPLTDKFIDYLDNSHGNNTITQCFVLKNDVLGLISNHYPWSLVVRLTENPTSGADKIFIESSSLIVRYSEPTPPAPVPEPTSMLLLGSGFMGLVGFGCRKMRA